MNPSSPDDDSAFVRRYAEDPQSISREEAVRRHQQVAAQLPSEDYRQAAEAALTRLSPQERVALGRYLLTQAPAAGGIGFPDVNGDGIDDRLQDPRYLAGVTAQAQQQPGLLDRLLAGMGLAPAAPGPAGYPPPGGSPGGSPGGYAPASGEAGGQLAGALGGTLGKVALGGIAAAGLARLLGGGFGRGGHHGGHH